MLIRKLLLYAHLVTGLTGAIFLFILGGTGGVLVFENEIDHCLNAKLMKVQPAAERLSLNALTKKLEDAYPGARVNSFIISTDDGISMSAGLRGGKGGGKNVFVNQYTGEVRGNVSDKNSVMSKIHQFHTNLLMGKKGKTITLWGAILLLLLAITGIILWWPRKIFKMSRSTSGSRTNFELHLVAGFYSSLFMLMFGITGVVIHWDEQAQGLVNRLAGVPEPPPMPKPATPAKGAVPLSADELVNVALKLVPGAKVTVILGFGTLKSIVRVIMKYPEDGTPAGRTNLALDSTTGQVLSMQTSRTGTLGMRVAKLWNREMHTGDFYGWPTRVLASLAAFALPLLAITGPLIWWRRTWRKKTIPDGL